MHTSRITFWIGICTIIITILSNGQLNAQISTTAEKSEPTTENTTPSIEDGPYTVIKIDLNSQSLLGVLPFDVPFFILGETNPQFISAQGWFIKEDKAGILAKTIPCNTSNWTELKKWSAKIENRPYVFSVPRLNPNTDYAFYFKFERTLTDDEQTRLVSYVNDIVKPFINQKAMNRDGSYEFYKADREKIVTEVNKKINDYLAKKDLRADLSSVSDENMKSCLEAVKTISKAYEDRRDYKRNLDNGISLFANQKESLSQLRNNYYVNTKEGSNKIANLKYLDKVLADFNGLNPFPENEDAMVDSKVQIYLTKLKTLLLDLKSANVDKDKPIQTERQYIIENTEKMISDYNNYILVLKTVETITTEQSATLVKAVSEIIYNDAIVSGSSINDFNTRAKNYISADLGVAVISGISKVLPYVGTNIYFRPVNKDRPLLWSDGWDQIGRRFSLMIGLSVTSLAKDNEREDLFGGNFNLITGAGIRVWDGLRINGGVLWYQRVNSNPLISKTAVRCKPFVSLSFDIDIKTVFNNLFTPTVITNSTF